MAARNEGKKVRRLTTGAFHEYGLDGVTRSIPFATESRLPRQPAVGMVGPGWARGAGRRSWAWRLVGGTRSWLDTVVSGGFTRCHPGAGGL